MARILFADPGSRFVYRPVGTSIKSASGVSVTIYSDAAGTVLADIAEFDTGNPGTPGPIIADATLTTSATSLLPWFWGPTDGTDTLYASAAAGPVTPINAYYDPRIDDLEAGSVPDTRQVVAGVGLTGGGALTSDVTLDVDFGTTAGSKFSGEDGGTWNGTAHQSTSVQYPSQPTIATAEVAYTPTLTNVTLGSGTLVGYYSKVGKRVTGSVYIQFAADTVVSGTIQFSLPTDAPLVAGSQRRYDGGGWMNDFSATQRYMAALLPFGTTAISVRAINTAGTYALLTAANATVPFTWAVSDELLVEFEYETA